MVNITFNYNDIFIDISILFSLIYVDLKLRTAKNTLYINFKFRLVQKLVFYILQTFSTESWNTEKKLGLLFNIPLYVLTKAPLNGGMSIAVAHSRNNNARSLADHQFI